MPMLTFDRASDFSNLDEADLAYLQVIPPSWMLKDPLYEQMNQLAHLYLEGKVVWGCIIQANQLLLNEDNSFSCPAEVLYDPTGDSDIEQLQEVASKLYELKGTKPDDPELIEYANHITDERTRLVSYDVPKTITTLPLKSTSMFIWRLHLPNGVLQQIFPMLISNKTDETTVLPAKFWNKDLYDEWTYYQHFKADMYSGVRQLYLDKSPWKKHKKLFRPTIDELKSISFSNITDKSITDLKEEQVNEYRLTSKGFVDESINNSLEDRKSEIFSFKNIIVAVIVFVIALFIIDIFY